MARKRSPSVDAFPSDVVAVPQILFSKKDLKSMYLEAMDSLINDYEVNGFAFKPADVLEAVDEATFAEMVRQRLAKELATFKDPRYWLESIFGTDMTDWWLPETMKSVIESRPDFKKKLDDLISTEVDAEIEALLTRANELGLKVSR